MNVKRFTARNSREAMALVRRAFGDDAVVLSNKPCAEGVEVLAMAPEGMSQIERVAATAPRVSSPGRVQARPVGAPNTAQAAAQPSAAARSFAARTGQQASPRAEPSFGYTDPAAEVGADVETLAMSTLSFQDYVRERVLKRRQAELDGLPDPVASLAAEPQAELPAGTSSLAAARQQRAQAAMAAMQPRRAEAPAPAAVAPARRSPPVLRDEIRMPAAAAGRELPGLSQFGEFGDLPDLPGRGRRDQQDMMNELRSMKGLIEERFGALAFMEKLQRQPTQARLTQKMLEVGFSPALVRKLVEGCPNEFKGAGAPKGEAQDETVWAAQVLSRNLLTDERSPALEDQGGVFALIGSTGVGKTTTTAKLAAAFATRYGAANLGLITLDAYRVGAHEQLRAYGRILGVPVHTAHDRASLEDLLELLSGKKMVLIDTAGMAQRDTRTTELLDMLAHASVRKILVVNAAQQGETIEDVVNAWRAHECHGLVLSKIDEAVKLAPALDTLIRHKLKVLGVANGQRVPEDWHRLSSQALVQRALRSTAGGAWRMDSADVNLIFAGSPALASAHPAAMGTH
ncbi:flagellar biosynthesis protein FlhF [Paucibacter oligotrophus]|uniref:Flagellar biosynthesis protein FlhF n=1 Tax=Roseateles oligotrophus TaxID=1769250 RepID=A0A840LA16_9BURK|nr:flagellar biosynthesis protein FlhF [Roseateles oligotrophus]MBB4843583.1 flagellar biosynthesis protein FlhF [Roseateles oligotrophus]